MWSNYCKIVFLILGIMKLVSGDNCLDVDSVIQRDKYMEHQVFRKIRSQSPYTCATECLMSSACLSFGFENTSRTCLLNSRNSSDDAIVVTRTGFLFSDVQHWPKSLSGRCAQMTCQNNTHCEVTRLGLARCVPEFQGCGDPPDVHGANIMYDGHYEGAVATYSCRPDFRTCHNNVASTCLSSGAWESIEGLCGLYRWRNPNAALYAFPCGLPRNFWLIINAEATKATKWGFMIKKLTDKCFYSEFRLGINGESNVVVITSALDDVWGAEKRVDVALTVGKAMTIQITLRDGVYRLQIDGAIIHNLAERDHGAIPDHFNFFGDVSVSMIELGSESWMS